MVDPKVMAKNIYCPTFVVYLEVIEDSMKRKQKIILDGDEQHVFPHQATNHQARPFAPTFLFHLAMTPTSVPTKQQTTTHAFASHDATPQ